MHLDHATPRVAAEFELEAGEINTQTFGHVASMDSDFLLEPANVIIGLEFAIAIRNREVLEDCRLALKDLDIFRNPMDRIFGERTGEDGGEFATTVRG